MEKLFNDKDAGTKKLVKEAGVQSPSAEFSKNIMKQIARKQKLTVTAPLLSKSGWLVVLTVVFVSAILLYVYPMNISVFEKAPSISKLSWNLDFKKFPISKSTVYGFVFLALFLLQIPVLKKTLEKRL